MINRSLLTLNDTGVALTGEAPARPPGLQGYLGMAFIAFWLIGWLVGELTALSAVAPTLPLPRIPGISLTSTTSPKGPAELFLWVWLGIWTIGGVAAIWMLISWAIGRVHVRFSDSGVECWQSPIGRRIHIPGEAVQYITLNAGAIMEESGARGRLIVHQGDNKTVGLLASLSVDEAQTIIDTLRGRFRELPVRP